LSSFIQIALTRAHPFTGAPFFVPTLGAILIFMATHLVFLLLSDKKNIGKAETALPTET
jgi:hypothetical protein